MVVVHHDISFWPGCPVDSCSGVPFYSALQLKPLNESQGQFEATKADNDIRKAEQDISGLYLMSQVTQYVLGKQVEIGQVLLQDVINDLRAYLPVKVDESVTELDHLAKGREKGLRDDSLLGKDLKRFGIILRCAEPLTGNDVIADIQTTFYSDLKKVLGAFNLCEIG